MDNIASIDATETALVAFGANLPVEGMAPPETVAAAMSKLAERTGAPITMSRLFRTPAFPKASGPDFVNAAAALPWRGSAQALLKILHGIEESFGRTRTTRWEARIMDLDLIALGQTVLPDAATQTVWANLPTERAAVETPDQLILPHPRLAERGFVLVPLADIAAHWVHPLHGQSIADMVDALPMEERAEIWALNDAKLALS